jgi:hypothetical protein
MMLSLIGSTVIVLVVVWAYLSSDTTYDDR